MFKTKLKVLLVLFTALLITCIGVVNADNPTGETYSLVYLLRLGNDSQEFIPLGDLEYGSSVTIDQGTTNPSYEFATYILNNKVEPYFNESHTFLVTGDMQITMVYKPINTYMVSFMDANQDVLDIQFIPNDGNSDASPPITVFLDPIPGYTISSTTPWLGGSYEDVTEDRVLYVNYVPNGTPATHTLTVNNGTGSGTYNFNQVVTVTATGGTGNFQHWERGGDIVSLNPTYSFTLLKNTTITAVYDTPVSPDPDGLFINFIELTAVQPGHVSSLCQFTLPDGIELIEYGIIYTPEYEGGITLDTPNIIKTRVNKHNPNTNEYLLHLNSSLYGSFLKRGYMITTNGMEVTITYSPVTFGGSPTIPTDISLPSTGSVNVSATLDLDPTFTPTGATEDVIWHSSDESIATVDSEGVVTGVIAGEVTITAYSFYDHSVYAICTVTVTNPT